MFKVEYFLYIIQIMLQYTPSFNNVCYTLRLQGCFLQIYKTKYYASAGGYVAQGCSFIPQVIILHWKNKMPVYIVLKILNITDFYIHKCHYQVLFNIYHIKQLYICGVSSMSICSHFTSFVIFILI